jgi:hypothetical protein
MLPNTRLLAMNAKSRRQKVALIILVGIVILLVTIRSIRQIPKKAMGDDTVDQPNASPNSTARVFKPVKVTWPVGLSRDVFSDNEAPPPPQRIVTSNSGAITQEAAAKLELHGIILGNPSRAMINGHALSQGESIDGFYILSIETRRVVLKKQGVTVELKL